MNHDDKLPSAAAEARHQAGRQPQTPAASQAHLATTLKSAAEVEFDFGRDSSAGLNGNDRDATRRRAEAEE